MLIGLCFIVIGYVVPFCCHQWTVIWLNRAGGPISMTALHGYFTFLECLQILVVLLGLNLIVAALTRSKIVRTSAIPHEEATARPGPEARP